jgi:cell division protein FtsB
VQCVEDDPQRVWRLETLLENACATASEEKRCNEMLHGSLTKNGATIGKQEGEIESLQEENERLQEEIECLRDESVVAKDNERLRAELLLTDEAADLTVKTAAKVAKLVEGLEVALR